MPDDVQLVDKQSRLTNSPFQKRGGHRRLRRRTIFGRMLVVLLFTGVGLGLVAARMRQAEGVFRHKLEQDAQAIARGIDSTAVVAGDRGWDDSNRAATRRLDQQLTNARRVFGESRYLFLLSKDNEGKLASRATSGLEADQIPFEATTIATIANRLALQVANQQAVFIGRHALGESEWVGAAAPVVERRSRRTAAMLVVGTPLSEWRKDIVRATLPVIVVWAVLLVLLFGPWGVVFRRGKTKRTKQVLGMVRPAGVLAVSIVITIGAAWLVSSIELASRSLAFRELSNRGILTASHILQDIEHLGMESLASYYSGSEYISQDEFERFAQYLSEDPLVQGWAWTEVVPREQKAAFEAEIRAEGDQHFAIWERSEGGTRVPASDREVYFPLTRIVPASVSDAMRGFDFGSTPDRRAALTKAMQSGLCGSTEPITLVDDPSADSSIVAVYPVFRNAAHHDLSGFVMSALRMPILLAAMGADNGSMLVQIAWLDGEGERREVAASSGLTEHGGTTKPATYVIHAFGGDFAVSAWPGPEFLAAHPCWGGSLVLGFGLVLSCAMAAIVRSLELRRSELSRQVAERSAEARLSQEHLAATLRSIGDGLLETNSRGIVVYMNHIAESLTGWKKEQALGHSVGDVLRIAGTSGCSLLGENGSSAGSFSSFVQGEGLLETRHGERRHISVTRTPVGEDASSPRGAVILFRDITEDYEQRAMLRSHKELFDQLAEQNRTVAWELNADAQFTYVSHVAKLLYGFSPAEMVGKLHVWDLAPPDERETFRQSLMQRYQCREAVTGVERRLVTKDGETLWVWRTAMPQLDEDGNLRGYRGSDTDITDRKLAEEAREATERKYQSIVESISDLFFETDKEGRLKLLRGSWASLTDEMLDANSVGVHSSDFFADPDDWGRFLRAIEEQGGRLRDFRVDMLRANGDLYPGSISCSYFRGADGAVLGIRGVVSDLTERCRVEDELRRANLRLAERSEQVVAMAQAAEAAARAKTAFVVRLSQGLLTPVKRIIEKAGPCGEEHTRRQVLELIDDIALLSGSYSEQPSDQYGPYRTRELEEDQSVYLAGMAEQANSDVRTHVASDVPDILYTKPLYLRRLLRQMLRTAANEVVRELSLFVHTTSLEDGRPAVQFLAVAGDVEPDAEYNEIVATLGETGETRIADGMVRLGLMIGRRFAESLGGSLRIAMTPGGRAVRLVIPFDLMAEEISKQPETGEVLAKDPLREQDETLPLTGIRIAMISDSSESQLLIAFILRRAGAYVSVHTGSQQALAVVMAANAAESPFDVVLLNLQTATAQIPAVAHDLRALGYRGKLIAFLPDGGSNVEAECLSAGCDECMIRPVDRERLFESLRSAMSRVTA